MNAHPHGEKISAYIDGMLDVAQMRDVSRHLHICETCRATCASFYQTRERLRGLNPAPQASADFWVNAYRSLRTDGAGRCRTSNAGARLRVGLLDAPRRWATGAAAIAVLGVLIAAPIASHKNVLPGYSGASSPSQATDVVDLSSLVRDHTQSAARQPLADRDRQTMLSADVDDVSAFGDTGVEMAGSGSFSSDVTP